MKIRKFPLWEFKDIYSKVPRLTVDVVLRTNEGIVLSKRDIPPAYGMWHIPGGTILYGETHADAVKRVAKEEMGLEVKISKFLGIIEYSKNFSLGQTTSIVYLIKVIDGKLSGSSQAKEIHFFKKLPKNIIPEQAKFLKEHFSLI